MKNNMMVFIALIFSALSLTAQTADPNVKDPKAKAILDKVTAKNKSYSSIEAEFVYKLQNLTDGIDESQSGSIFFSGNQYKLKIAGQEIYSDGITIWTFIPDANEVQISNVPDESEQDAMMNPSKLFSIYEKGFKYIFDKEETIGGVLVDVIKLYPENPNEKNFHTIILNVKKDSQIHSIVIKAKDGNTYTYELKKFTPNKPVNASNFKFDVTKAGDVIDLR